MEHYVIINDWSNEFESGVTILGVTHTFDEAKAVFDANVVEERTYASEHDWTIFEDNGVDFDAGVEGYYSTEHSRVYIQRV